MQINIFLLQIYTVVKRSVKRKTEKQNFGEYVSVNPSLKSYVLFSLKGSLTNEQ